MDNISDYIIPIALAIIWIVGKVMGSKEEEADTPPPASPRPHPESRTEDIQEEIRRKIAERQPEAHERPAPLPPPHPFEGEHQQHSHSQMAEPAEQPQVSYEEQLEEQQARLLAAQAQVQRVREETAAARQTRPLMPPPSGARPALATDCPIRQYVIDSVQDPNAARKAFVLQQVIGPPVAFRSQAEHAANWQ